ncbi:hypothetical protein C8P63_12512 [Melghirimyces profundicolus]|uniref:YprB ribonuclease H-like domain-containing protein n=1 Tax=Melghirimyces profundicolus TaxID=1242148 RepID=A0A2T6BCW8_9BACL|nr:ribonuclease H-like domain-containing protein [Melghirimyces profundicolus]PTX53894.1 hypothetical protein C8P63_12512 [Melghirimyces profundicolus]
MSSLRDRLRLHFKNTERPDSPASVKAEMPDAALGFSVRENGSGTYFHRRKEIPLETQIGRWSLGELREAGAGSDLLLPEEAGPEDLLFFDTETTGLGTGAGNLIFLYGIGYFREDVFVVEHYFLPRVGDEAALLKDFLERVAPFSVVVTYNGKAFDWNQLRTRATLHRFPWEGTKEHCDLLYPSRRLWRDFLPSCRLQVVESACLGLERKDDVPGHLAPALYFDFLKKGHLTGLDGVFRHNEQDVLSLVALFIHLHHLLEGRHPPGYPEEGLALGRWWQSRGKDEPALRVFGELLSGSSVPLRIRREAFRESARILKRQGNWSDAHRLWTEWMEEDAWNPEPCVELAKYFEHRTREMEPAYRTAREALRRLSKRRRTGLRVSDKEREALKHRIRRLEEKREGSLF